MVLAARRSSRLLLFVGAVLTFVILLHVLYSNSSVPQWRAPSFLSESKSPAGEHLDGVPIGIVSEPETVLAHEHDDKAGLPSLRTSTSQTGSTTQTRIDRVNLETQGGNLRATSAAQAKVAAATPSTSLAGDGTQSGSRLTSQSTKAAPSPYPTNSSSLSEASSKIADAPPCRSLKGGEDVLVVMRTGATEIRDKLTMHLNTTFQCYSNLVIFSDYEETFAGYQVHDALRYMDDDIKAHNDDFEHYRRLQEVGRAGLDQSELSGKLSWESGPTGKTDNAGWRLDKWKFLPMANMTLALYPNMKWYVFVEPDTYLVWSNLLQWIPKLDPSKPLYFGSEVMIGDDIFAHGGSAFLMSRPALESGVRQYERKTKELNDFTAGHWAGDCVLGKTLHDAGTELTWTWPMFQGGNPSLMNFLEGKGDGPSLWCSPAISYHHFNPKEVQSLFQFEQGWIKSTSPEAGSTQNVENQQPILHHFDVFDSYIMPNLTMERSDWNNTSENLEQGTMGASLADCRMLCESKKSCMQYALSSAGCHFDSEAKLGRNGTGWQSGWLVPRVEKWVRSLSECKKGTGWTKPE